MPLPVELITAERLAALEHLEAVCRRYVATKGRGWTLIAQALAKLDRVTPPEGT